MPSCVPQVGDHHVRMDNTLSFFANSVGACERILKSPIPLSYTRHVSVSLLPSYSHDRTLLSLGGETVAVTLE